MQLGTPLRQVNCWPRRGVQVAVYIKTNCYFLSASKENQPIRHSRSATHPTCPVLSAHRLGHVNTRSTSAFSVKPSVGEIPAESFVLVCVRFSPTEIKRYTDLLCLVINGDDGGRAILEGQGAVPFLIVPDLLLHIRSKLLDCLTKPPLSFPKI
jgi:hypothetical protein